MKSWIQNNLNIRYWIIIHRIERRKVAYLKISTVRHRFYAPNMLDIDFMLPICSTSILCSQYAWHRFYAPNMLDIDFMLPICLTHIMIKISSHFIGSKRRDSSLEKSVFLSVLISIKFIECQNIFGTQKQKYLKQSGWNLKL